MTIFKKGRKYIKQTNLSRKKLCIIFEYDSLLSSCNQRFVYYSPKFPQFCFQKSTRIHLEERIRAAESVDRTIHLLICCRNRLRSLSMAKKSRPSTLSVYLYVPNIIGKHWFLNTFASALNPWFDWCILLFQVMWGF